MFLKPFCRGDRVVYCLTKYKAHPGRHACNVHPAAHGDDYSYYVEKFWVVFDVLPDGRLLRHTPRRKSHLVNASDPNLRHATWLERIRCRDRSKLSDMASGGSGV